MSSPDPSARQVVGAVRCVPRVHEGGRGDVLDWDRNRRDAVGDIIFINGHVLTGDSQPSDATAVAIRLGRVAVVGTDEAALRWSGQGVEVVDLKGRTVAPGLTDAHCHPIWVGLGLTAVNCASPPNRTVADIVGRIAERAAAT